jgi:hypothetical protein
MTYLVCNTLKNIILLSQASLIYTYNPTWEAEIGKIVVWSQPRQKVHETPCQPIAGHGDSLHVIPLQREV